MKVLPLSELTPFIASLAGAYDVRLPVRLADGTRIWGRPQEGDLALEGAPVPRRPSEIFFPQHDPIFTASPGRGAESPPPPEKPLLVLGLTPVDLDALEFTDAFFAAGLRDPLYFARRDGAVIVGISGGWNGADILPVSGGKCDLELIRDGDRCFVSAYTKAGRALAARVTSEEEGELPDEFRRASSDDPVGELLRRASQLLLADRVPDDFWQEVADRCIACTGCTLVCPTCTCFGVQDRCRPGRTERSRMWDSCQLDAFMREASGHNPLGTEALRTRRRIHHKLAADVRRWGRITCVACGRCETTCPTGIGLLSVAREMVGRFKGEGER